MMGYDPYEDPEDTDPWRDMSYKVKGEPKKGIVSILIALKIVPHLDRETCIG